MDGENMQGFKVFLEESRTKGLKGDPYIEVKWENLKNGLRLKLTYCWDGYEILSHQQSYSLPNEFGGLEATQDKEHPQWFYLNGIGIDKSFKRQGFATNLITKAMELIKSKGFNGIISDAESRSKEGDSWWTSLKTRQVGEYQVLEVQYPTQTFVL